MIISHKHKFIFLKTRKTAGTSIEIALSKFCGEDDLITPQVQEDEKIREERGYQVARNYAVPLGGYTYRNWASLIFKWKKTYYKRHTPASYVSQRIDPAVWNSYFKFCFERNPWDKAISLYYWLAPGLDPKPGLREYFQGEIDKRRLSNWYIYAMDDGLAVDYVARYENLDEELDRICERLNLPGKLELPHAKGQFRKDRRDYREVLDDQTRAVIDRICAKEIKLLGYEFDPRDRPEQKTVRNT